MYEIEIRTTEDGSHTLFNVNKNENYHSIHGAVQESMHVFISAGYRYLNASAQTMNILEIGFGTGLNTLLTIMDYVDNYDSHVKLINYYGIEPFPISQEIVWNLNYCDFLGKPDLKDKFFQLHSLPPFIPHKILDDFHFTRVEQKFEDYIPDVLFDLVFLDAFSPETEPGLWRRDIFEKIFAIMNRGGVLVTYCSKGVVRRSLQECGFFVERIPGPPGKHEMLRAIVK